MLKDSLCKSCRVLKSKNYCKNCIKKLERLQNLSKLAKNQRAIERRELDWNSRANKRSRLLIRLSRLSLKELAELKSFDSIESNEVNELVEFIKENKMT